MAAFPLVSMHDLADPIDAALGILGLAVPNAPAQSLDLPNDRGLCLHPSGIVGRQTACCLRRVLDPHCDVEPVKNGWCRDPGIDQDRSQIGTAVGASVSSVRPTARRLCRISAETSVTAFATVLS